MSDGSLPCPQEHSVSLSTYGYRLFAEAGHSERRIAHAPSVLQEKERCIKIKDIALGRLDAILRLGNLEPPRSRKGLRPTVVASNNLWQDTHAGSLPPCTHRARRINCGHCVALLKEKTPCFGDPNNASVSVSHW